MKDSGNMKVYHLRRDVYEGVLAFSHGFSMKQEIIYAPNYGIIAKNPNNEKEFFYIHGTKEMEDAQKIIDEKREGFIKEINVDVDDVTALLGFGNKMENAKKEFNNKAKSLFDIVAKEAPKGIKGCCD